jgi:hypothetical protein
LILVDVRNALLISGSPFGSPHALVMYVAHMAARVDTGAQYLLDTAGTGVLRDVKVLSCPSCLFSVASSAPPLPLTPSSSSFSHTQLSQDMRNVLSEGVAQLRRLLRDSSESMLAILKAWLRLTLARIAQTSYSPCSGLRKNNPPAPADDGWFHVTCSLVSFLLVVFFFFFCCAHAQKAKVKTSRLMRPPSWRARSRPTSCGRTARSHHQISTLPSFLTFPERLFT